MGVFVESNEDLVRYMRDEEGLACTVRRPHTVKRTDRGAVAGNVKTTTAVGASSFPIEIDDGGAQKADGKIPAGTVLVLGAVNYTLTAEAAFAADSATVSIDPVLAAEATQGDAVTLPAGASFSTFTYVETRKTEADVLAAGWGMSDRFAQVFHPETLPDYFTAFRAGRDGDYLDDSDGNVLGRIEEILGPAGASNVTTVRLV